MRIFTVGLRSRRLRSAAAPDDRRAHRRRLRGGALGGGARGDLRRARHAARGRVPRPLPLRRARPMSQVDVRRRRSPGAGRRSDGVRRADARRCSPRTTARSVSTFLLSGSSPLVVALFFGLLVCGLLLLLTRAPEDDGRRPRSDTSRTGRALPSSRASATVALRAATGNRYTQRLVGAARARPRARADDGDAAAGRGHGARRHRSRSLVLALSFSAPLLALFGLATPAGRPHRSSGGSSRRFATSSPSSSPAACRCSPRRCAPATASTARSASSSTTPASRRAPSWRGSCRTTGSACCPRTRSGKLARAHGQPRHRAGRAPRRAPAHVGRQLGRDPRHRRRHDPRARRSSAGSSGR